MRWVTYFSTCLLQVANRRHTLSISSQRPSGLKRKWKQWMKNIVFGNKIMAVYGSQKQLISVMWHYWMSASTLKLDLCHFQWCKVHKYTYSSTVRNIFYIVLLTHSDSEVKHVLVFQNIYWIPLDTCEI